MFKKDTYRILKKDFNIYMVTDGLNNEYSSQNVKSLVNHSKDQNKKEQHIFNKNELILLIKPLVSSVEMVDAINLNTWVKGRISTKFIASFTRNTMNDIKIYTLPGYKENSHFFGIFKATKPIYCYNCCDYIWGHSHQTVVCYFCGITFHKQTCMHISTILCDKNKQYSNIDYTNAIKPIDKWTNSDMIEWMFAAKFCFLVDTMVKCELKGDSYKSYDKATFFKKFHIESTEQFNNFYSAIKYLIEDIEPMEATLHCVISENKLWTYHVVYPYTFVGEVICCVCHYPLFGFHDQGLLCSLCKNVFHNWCYYSDVTTTCKINNNRKHSNIIMSSILLNNLSIHSSVDVISTIIPILTKMKYKYSQLPKYINLWGNVLYIEFIQKIYQEVEGSCNPNQLLPAYELSTFLCYINLLLFMIINLPKYQTPNEDYSFLYYESYVGKNDETIKIKNGMKLMSILPHEIDDLTIERRNCLKMLAMHYLKVMNAIEINTFVDIYSLSLFIPVVKYLKPFGLVYMNTKNILQEYLVKKMLILKRNMVKEHLSDSNFIDYQIWYWGEIDRNDAKHLLSNKPDHCFIIKKSSKPNIFTLLVRLNGVTKSMQIIYKMNDGYRISLPDHKSFNFLHDLVLFYRNHSIKYSHNHNLYPLYLKTPVITTTNTPICNNSNRDDLENKLKNLTINYKKIKNDEEFNRNNINELNLYLLCEEKFLEFIQKHILHHDEIIKNTIKNDAILNNDTTRMTLSKNEIYSINLREDTKIGISDLRNQIVMLSDYEMKLKKKCQATIKAINNINILLGDKMGMSHFNDGSLDHEWYGGDISKEEVKQLFFNLPDGSFLVRSSDRDLTQNVISIKYQDKVIHYSIEYQNELYSITGNSKKFESIATIIHYYKDHNIDEKLNIKLLYPVDTRKNDNLY